MVTPKAKEQSCEEAGTPQSQTLIEPLASFTRRRIHEAVRDDICDEIVSDQ